MNITIETLVRAPIDKVWRAYTSPEDIIQWNAASDDWHTTSSSVELRVGGTFSSRMEAKDGSLFDHATQPRLFRACFLRLAIEERLQKRFSSL